MVGCCVVFSGVVVGCVFDFVVILMSQMIMICSEFGEDLNVVMNDFGGFVVIWQVIEMSGGLVVVGCSFDFGVMNGSSVMQIDQCVEVDQWSLVVIIVFGSNDVVVVW